MPTRELTFGEKAVGLTFNPSGDPQVTAAKTLYAAIIDQLNDAHAAALKTPGGQGKAALLEVAVNQAVTAQMWAVKGITWPY